LLFARFDTNYIFRMVKMRGRLKIIFDSNKIFEMEKMALSEKVA